ncbi:MAG: sensor domain-containing diguanylate cyclase [Gudongella sp.]|nr:sensor domain-containing diguanylate cyclase [Gudongella sp.]
MDVYRGAIENTKCAFAYHRAVYDKEGNMVDYVFLDVNKAFEDLLGLTRDSVLNKRFVRDISRNYDYAMKWVKIYSQVVMESRPIEIDEFSEEFGRHFQIRAYSPEKDHFVTIFLDRTSEMMLLKNSRYFIDSLGQKLDYRHITQQAMELSGADYAAFNLFDDNGRDFKTMALCGDQEDIDTVLETMKINPSDIMKWDHDPEREKKIGNKQITVLESMYDLVGDVIPKELLDELVQEFKIGKVAVARITKDGKSLGDFTLIFRGDNDIRNREMLLFYLTQLGLFMEKTRAESELRKSRESFYTLAENAPIGFMSCTTDGQITFANKKLLEILDSPSREATLNINVFNLPELMDNGFTQKLKECIEKEEELTEEFGYTSIWGKSNWLRVHFTPSKENQEITGVNIVVDDATERKKAEEELKERANRDPLTRAYNRNALKDLIPERLQKAEENFKTSCVALLDIDDFKSINDNHGHRIGDDILKYLASRIKRELRDEDIIVRTGGDEFLIYLHDIRNEDNALSSIDRIFEKISNSYRIEDDFKNEKYNIDVGFSIGTSLFPRDGKTIDELMAKADQNLYRVKRNGKSDYFIGV